MIIYRIYAQCNQFSYPQILILRIQTMSRKQITLIYYHIPEDYDDPLSPNLFQINIPKNSIRLQHLYQHFPLRGSYIFRFKVMFNQSIAWLDLPSLDSKLPTFKDKIMVKASRISWEDSAQNIYGHYRFDKEILSSPENRKDEQKSMQKSEPESVPIQPEPKQKEKLSPHTNLLDDHHPQPPNSNNHHNIFDNGDLI